MEHVRKVCALLLSTAMVVSGMTIPSMAAGTCSSAQAISRYTKIPVVTVTSDLLGLADTGNKSTLKKTLVYTSGPGDINLYHYDENGDRVQYPKDTVVELEPVAYTGSAVIDLGQNVNDKLIDSSKATVKLLDGDGYYADELILNADSLDGEWVNGKYTYTLDSDALEWYTGDYPLNDYNSGREWSCFGGDGNGVYTFNLEVSGIRYAGIKLNSAVFQVPVYIYGRSATDMAEKYNSIPDPTATQSTSGVTPSKKLQWTWISENETADLPLLCDTYADNFYITWPKGTDASEITADDVKITLYSQYGDSYELSARTDYDVCEYEVFSGKEETQIAVDYMQWSYVPVYTNMVITVKSGKLFASKIYRIASVGAHTVQTGGGGVTVDGTVTCYNLYGYDNLNDWTQVMNAATYTLTWTDEEGKTWYYAEDEGGNGYLVEKPEAAEGPGGPGGPGAGSSIPEGVVTYDASGAEDCNQRLIGNVAYITTRIGQTAERTVNGETITFDKVYSTKVTLGGEDMAARGVTAEKGYAISNSSNNYDWSMWSWAERYRSGWTTETPQPVGLPYVSFPYGY